MSIFELTMLCCFGFSWPVSVFKIWKTKSTAGKSLVFTFFIWIGYIAGTIHKLLYSRDFVLAIYLFNLINVSADLALYFYYRRFPGGRKAAAESIAAKTAG
jgi:hypothetical protein